MALWRWQWNANHSIPKDSRAVLFHAVESLMYSRSQQDVLVANIIQHTGTHETPDNYIKYITYLIARKEEWSLVFCHHLPTNGKDTNNTE